MSDWGYVWLGWGLTVGRARRLRLWIILRGRALSRRVPPEDRRWL